MKKQLILLLLPILGYGQITFTKEDNSDAALEQNQDRISDNVWLTRATGGGALFNAFVEDSFEKGKSPMYTEWAVGTTSQIINGDVLDFRVFLFPQGNNYINKPPLDTDIVLKLTNNTSETSDDVYYDIKFISWTAGGAGGFSYTRSTTPILSLFDNSNTISIYPNPTTSILIIGGGKEYDIKVFDMAGNKLMALTGNSINMAHLSTATYIVKATDKSNNEELTYKVVKN